jgi:Undecaprenyl-phosphate glucose phosphotransferase
MTEMSEIAPGAAVFASARKLPFLLGRSLPLIGPFAEALVIVGLSVLAGVAYHLVVYHQPGIILDYAKVGAIVALFHLIPQFHRQLGSYVTSFESHVLHLTTQSLRHQFYLWNLAFLCLLALGFVGKITGTYSRGAIALFYVSGLPLLLIWHYLWTRLIRRGLVHGWIAMRRGVLLGTPEKIEEFMKKHCPSGFGLVITHTVELSEEALGQSPASVAALRAALRDTVNAVRSSSLDDVFVLLPWSATHAVSSCADRLMTVPASVHLGPEEIFDRFSDIRLSKLGHATTLNLIRPPLTRFEVASKRLFDLVVATIGLIMVAPVLVLVAILIKLDSPGPIFFRQRRHGFNHKQFQILKFRTMKVAEDGDTIHQVTLNDPRLTRIGAYLRRWNLDELPQLVNVIKGDMSLVGPRPHALTHNREFERKIAFYARRHNIKPGITGWAQVNGLRGITDAEYKMKWRVEHDLYYIDNWSILFDVYILILTVLSPKTFKNAH